MLSTNVAFGDQRHSTRWKRDRFGRGETEAIDKMTAMSPVRARNRKSRYDRPRAGSLSTARNGFGRRLLQGARPPADGKAARRVVGYSKSAGRLAHVSGIVEEHVLISLVQAGVRAETLAAVGLIPMVEVAWCDGIGCSPGRDAVLNAAVAMEFTRFGAPTSCSSSGSMSSPILKSSRPGRNTSMSCPGSRPKRALRRCERYARSRRRVAAAAGGFLGLSTISKHEQAKIDELAKAWDA